MLTALKVNFYDINISPESTSLLYWRHCPQESTVWFYKRDLEWTVSEKVHTEKSVRSWIKLKSRACSENHLATADHVCLNQWTPSCKQTSPKPGRREEKKNPQHFAHLLHNNTQWSQNEMTSFTIFMAFCLLFYTIYNHLISFFSTREEKMFMYNKSLLLQT